MEQISEDSGSLTVDIVTMKDMMAKKVEPDPFNPPHLKLKENIQTKLQDLLIEYQPQFAQDETTIGTTSLTKMTRDIGNSEPVSQKPYPIVMKHYIWVKDKSEKLLIAKIYEQANPVGQYPL